MTDKIEATEYREFLEQFGGHELTVLHNDDDYRHLRMRARDEDGGLNLLLGYDVVTWPGALAVSGDALPEGAEGVIFSRLRDPIEFFTVPPSGLGPSGPDIDYAHWVEKLRGPAQTIGFEHDPSLFLASVRRHLAEHVADGELSVVDAERIAADAENHQYNEDDAYAWLDLGPQKELFPDAWEYNFRSPSKDVKNLCRRVELAVRKYNDWLKSDACHD